MMYSGLQILESTVFSPTPDQSETQPSKTIIRDGKAYFPRQDITVVMVLGIDRYGPMVSSGSYNNPGDADMIALLIFDETNKNCSVLYINRDTMMEMPVLGIGGKEAGTRFAQVTLSHTYGSGLQDSCENVKKTLEAFLPGMTVDYYVSMHMDAISTLNDAVGGVKVNVKDDFSDVDPTITKGEMILKGEQALLYVRTRKDVGDQKNITRMERQQEYVGSFLESFRACAKDSASFTLKVFEQVSDYITTNSSVTTLSGIMDRYLEYPIVKMVTPKGENVMGETYFEFYADEEALDDLVLELFYAEK
jgi:LCP family protein required for cell wall assembly